MNSTTRRDFLKRLAAAGAAVPAFLSARAAKAQDKHPDVRVALIGTGGMGGAHVGEMANLGVTVPCFCDVDTNNMGHAKELWPKAHTYQDYRKMLDKEAKNIDGVMIGIPDHHHFPATIMAMQLGLHVYTQKPLVHTVWEARTLWRAAHRYKVVTQMGNQGHASENWRKLYEMINSGGIGDVKEVHTWSDRPIWPQGMNRPEGKDEVPPNLDWDIWLGPAPVRPFKNGAYHPFVWRGWFDFGTGALGDMACHMMDGMYWSMDPGQPTSIEPVEVTGMTKEAFPNSEIIKWEFPKKIHRPGFTQYWHDGGLKPPKPEGMAGDLGSNGSIFIGTKGTIIVHDAGGSIETAPASLMDEIGNPPQMLPRSVGHYLEWVLACKGEGRTWSNFEYSAALTETVILGVVAMKVGDRIEYDGEAMKITNIPDANEFLTKDYRTGWKTW